MTDAMKDTSTDYNSWLNPDKSFAKFPTDATDKGNFNLHFMKEYDPKVVFPSNDNAQDVIMKKGTAYTIDVRIEAMGTAWTKE